MKRSSLLSLVIVLASAAWADESHPSSYAADSGKEIRHYIGAIQCVSLTQASEKAVEYFTEVTGKSFAEEIGMSRVNISSATQDETTSSYDIMILSTDGAKEIQFGTLTVYGARDSKHICGEEREALQVRVQITRAYLDALTQSENPRWQPNYLPAAKLQQLAKNAAESIVRNLETQERKK